MAAREDVHRTWGRVAGDVNPSASESWRQQNRRKLSFHFSSEILAISFGQTD